MKLTNFFPILILMFLFTSCSPTGLSNTSKIEITSPYLTSVLAVDAKSTPQSETSGMPSMDGGNGAAFMVIKNTGGVADRLLKAQSEIAKSVEIHQTRMKNNMMEMQPVEAVDIPANATVELKPGDYHIMFIGLDQGLKVGDKIKITLAFEKAGSIIVDAEVRKP